MISKEELGQYLEQKREFLNNFDLQKLIKKQEELQKTTQNESFWENNDTKLIKELAKIEGEIEILKNFENYLQDLEVAYEIGEENEFLNIQKNIQKETEILHENLFFNEEFDDFDSLLNIHSGAGGVDAQDFAGMLLNMYQSFCKKMDWDFSILSFSAGEEGGVKSASIQIKGLNSYGFLKEEIGTHRLIRLSPFNAGHTRETSFASVEVLPLGLENIDKDLVLDEKDLKWDYFMSSGKGGQSVNTTYSAVRVTFLPENIVVTCQNERSQQQNKEQALKVLKSRIIHKKIEENKAKIDNLKGVEKSADFGSQIRSYVMHPYKMVKDHRSKFEIKDVESVLNGEKLSDFIMAFKKFKK